MTQIINGIRDTLEIQIGGIPISVSPNNWTNVSDTINGYLVKLDTLPITNIIAPGVLPYRTFTPSSYAVTTTSLGLVPRSYNFAMSAQPNITDLVTRISTWFVRPGFQTSTSMNVENIGTVDETSITVRLIIPNGLSVISTNPASGVVTGNTVTWSGESIAIFERKSYSVSLQVPATMPLGTSLTYTATALPAGNDFTADNNYAEAQVVVRGSYDPNDKQVNKDRLPNNYVAADEEMLYTIRFQNTGSDTAFTVLIHDTLDLAKLDFSTFRVTGASHALRTNVRERGVVEFVFNNILLPDSFVNEPLSHGYVQFRIHPKANLPLGTQIKNRAFIYFDFNTPIITNFATTTVGLLSVSSAELGAGSLSLYPVPVAKQLTVNFNAVRSGEVRYRLLDLQGRLLQEQQLSVVEGENISTMDMGKLGAGMYLLQVVGEQVSVSSKIVKE